ncbi:MAG: methyltransferase domain-containing protein [Thermoleophilia bacterium]
MATDEVRAAVGRLVEAVEALAAVGGAAVLRVSHVDADPEIRGALEGVVDALGVRAAWDDASTAELAPLLPLVRTALQQAVELVADPARAPGWSYTDVELLQSAGQASAAFPQALAERGLEHLAGLAGRLDAPGASFLDVGVGVGGIAVAMCQRWPALRVVGIDPWEPALAIARRAVAAAGLEARIELRPLAVEALADEAVHDLAYVPAPFLPPAILPAAVERVARALAPGGWLVLASYRGEGALGEAVARLRTVRSGGTALAAAAGEALLREVGLVDVATLPDETWASARLVVGRRAA